MFYRPDYQNVGHKIQTAPNSRGKSIVVEDVPWLDKIKSKGDLVMDYVKGLGEGTVVRCRLLNCDKPDNNGNIYTKQAIEDAVGKFKAQSIKYVYSSLDKPDISNRLGTILDMTLGYDGALEALVRFDPNDDCVDFENKLIVENIQKALLDGDLKKISVSFSAQMEEEDVLVDENGNSVVKKCVITHMSVEAVKINN